LCSFSGLAGESTARPIAGLGAFGSKTGGRGESAIQVRINTANKLARLARTPYRPSHIGCSTTVITVVRYYLWRAFLLTQNEVPWKNSQKMTKAAIQLNTRPTSTIVTSLRLMLMIRTLTEVIRQWSTRGQSIHSPWRGSDLSSCGAPPTVCCRPSSSFRSVKSVKSVVEFPRPCLLPPRHHQRRKSRHGQRQNRQP